MIRSSLKNLKNYRVTLTTSFETKHGVSGHLFEMIEYFMHFRFHVAIPACILVTDGTTEEEFWGAIHDKYDLSVDALLHLKEHVYFAYQPKVILAQTLLICDGSLRMHGADLICDKIVLFRCADTDIVRDDVLVLQDNDVYEPLPNSQHYKKKILFEKYKKYNPPKINTAMFYLTTNSRSMTNEQIQEIISKHNFGRYIAISNDDIKLDNVEVIRAPVDNLWHLFGTYIYTNTALKFDCSPRFIAECDFYGKDVIYEIDYFDKGLEVRKRDIQDGAVWLTKYDEIYTKI